MLFMHSECIWTLHCHFLYVYMHVKLFFVVSFYFVHDAEKNSSLLPGKKVLINLFTASYKLDIGRYSLLGGKN